MFEPTSRYYGLPTGQRAMADGRVVAYVLRRFVPPADRFDLLEEHAVVQGERLDQIAAAHIGDPELFWRVCDANAAMRPADLVAVPGRRLRITLPEGIPVNKNA